MLADHLMSKMSNNKLSGNLLELLGTHFLICNEKVPTKGEDCGFEAYTTDAGVIGVFDGCGGLGARACSNLSGKTEAYIASRAVGSAVKMWFEAGYRWELDKLKHCISHSLSICKEQSGETGSRIKGSLIRSFPTTLALVTFCIKENELISKHIWAGDSRTYILDQDGLGQISTDDNKGEDAMDNLTRDGALTNVLSSDMNFTLHSRSVRILQPSIVISATDGCFGYVSSPMEFELLLLKSLVEASNVDSWQRILSKEISYVSGDDQSIAVSVFGFDDFNEMKNYFDKRYQTLTDIVKTYATAEPDEGMRIWKTYKPNYYRFNIGEQE